MEHTMTQNSDAQGLQSKAEARHADPKNERLVTRISVLSTSLGHGKTTERLMIGMSVETHKTSPDFDQKKVQRGKEQDLPGVGRHRLRRVHRNGPLRLRSEPPKRRPA